MSSPSKHSKPGPSTRRSTGKIDPRERKTSVGPSNETDFLVTLGKQIKNDSSRDAVGTKQRVVKLVQFLLNVHSPCSFELTVSRINELYPCPSLHSYSTNETRFLNTECINHIICHGESMEKFKQDLQQFDDSKVCGRVWKHNFLAYRCKTCALSPCMSLCNECFHLGDHKGHDYNMFRSQAGGACDCGDENVLLPSGFCVNHGHQKPDSEPPDKLLSTAKIVIPHLLLRLVSSLRQYEVSARSSVDDKSLDFNRIVAWLEELTLLGQAMRKTITQLMLSQEVYLEMTNHLGDAAVPDATSDQLFAAGALLDYQKSRGFDVVMKSGPPLKLFPNHNFIEEIFFWGVVYGLPEPLTTFFLNLLPDQSYKNDFARVFLRHYPALTHTLLNNPGRIDAISNNIVHISVQLFSNESLALEMVLSEDDLLHVLLTCLTYMVQQLNVQSTLFEGEYHSTVDISMEVVSKHCYWSIFSDFLNLLAHASVVEVFLSRKVLMQKYSNVLESFTGMDGQQRAIYEHIEYESSNYLTAFSVEIEACASPMWSLVYHQSLITKKTALELLRILHTDLLDTITSLGINIDSNEFYMDHVSFHWPLHRSFIVLLTRVLNKLKTREEGKEFKEQIGLSRETVKQLLFAPLHLLCRVNEISCNLWVRNGTSVIQQSLTYMQPHFSHSLVDADLLFVQFAATYLNPDYFLERFLAMQGLKYWFAIGSYAYDDRSSSDALTSMAESVLRLIALVVNSRLSLGMDEEQFCKEELMASLSVADKPYSHLMDIVTEKMNHNLSSEFKEMAETLMELLAVFSPPGLGSDGVMRQGIYQLTLQSWLLSFDPLHTSLRSMRKSDFQNAMHRYSSVMATNGYCTAAENLWPPFKPLKPISVHYESLLNILQSKTLLGIVFTVLYKAVHNENSLPESLLALAVHLLSLSIDHYSKYGTTNTTSTTVSSSISSSLSTTMSTVETTECTSSSTQGREKNLVDTDFKSWFHQDSVVENCSSFVDYVAEKSLYKSQFLQSLKSEARNYAVKEDILSLLIKLHNKLHREGKNYTMSDLRESSVYHHNYNCGSAVHHIKLVLARIMEFSSAGRNRVKEIIEELSPPVPTVSESSGLGLVSSEGTQRVMTASSSPSAAKIDFLERKRRAREKNRELMKAMQQKQTKFLEANYDDVMAAANEQSTASGEEDNSLKRCVICNQIKTPSPSTGEGGSEDTTTVEPSGANSSTAYSSSSNDYLVIMAFGQISNVLSKRRSGESNAQGNVTGDSQLNTSMEEDCEGASLEPVTVSKLYQDRIYQYLKLFPDSHVPVGFLDACLSPAGVLSISMCDHIAHNSCINKYKATLHIHDDDISSGGISNRLFNCPVCRKKCNFTVPILSSDPQKPSQQTAPIANFPTSETHLDKVLRDYSNQYIKSEMNKVLTDAPVSTMLLSGNPIYQLSMILYYPVLFELMSNGNKLPSKSYTTQTEKISSFYNLCLNIRRFYLSTSAQEESSSVSNLFGDSFLELLAQLVLTDFSKNLEMVLDSLVLSTLKREIVKQLLFWTWQLSEDERKAWTNAPSNKRPSRSPSGGETVLSSIPLVMRLFEQAFIKNVSTSGGSESCDQLAFLQPSTSSANCAISAVIWSEKSLESYLQDQTKQFLMLSVLLKSKLLNRPLLGCSDRSSANTDDHLLSHFNINEKNLLDLSFDDANEVITDMFALLTEKSKKQRRLRLDECKDLVSWTSLKSEFRSPKLITLPDDYDTLYRMYRKRKCNSCNLTPVNLSVCLICADLICVQERCCRKRTRTAPSRSFVEDVGYWNEACAHAQSCGNGVGVVLMLTTSQVLVLFNHLAAIWGCLHLDSHGEEDKELRRGKPLFLSKERYEMLNDQWMKLKFDGAHIKWFSHANKL